MTVADVQNKVAAIRAAANKEDDFDTAHMLEDSLYQGVLEHIASGRYPHLDRQLAMEALKSKAIVFDRRTA